MQDLRKFLPFPQAQSDSKYYNTGHYTPHKKGEIFELRQDLNSKSLTRRIDAMKAVIASMTIGKDVSSLFPEVIKCICTSNLELKKLAYLYLTHYAQTQPDLVILAVNTFCLDATATAEGPIVRALAIRTMGNLRVARILDHICDPLKHALKDPSAYVRKTAALCIPKIFELSPALVEEFGFAEELIEMLVSSSNPMVVSNACAALNEMSKLCISSSSLLFQLLSALNDCTEWGQVALMECLASYTPKDAEEALHILIHVTPRLNHVNSAVVMASVRIIYQICTAGENGFLDEEHATFYLSRIVSPLLSLLSSTSYSQEIVYCTLRTLKMMFVSCTCKWWNELFGKNAIPLFFCKYTDPIWVKREKVEILQLLASTQQQENAPIIVAEFLEYCQEGDLEFSLLSLRALVTIAIQMSNESAEIIGRLIRQLKESKNVLLNNRIIYILSLLLRAYPDEGIIQCAMLENLPDLDQKIDVASSEEACEGILLMIQSFKSPELLEWILELVPIGQMTPKCQSLAIHAVVMVGNNRMKSLLWLESLQDSQVPALQTTISLYLNIVKHSWHSKDQYFAQFPSPIATGEQSLLQMETFRLCSPFINEIGTLQGIQYERLPTSPNPNPNEHSAAATAQCKEVQLGQLLDLDLSLVSPTRSNSTLFHAGPYPNLMDFEEENNSNELVSEDSHCSSPSTPFAQSILALSTDLFDLTYAYNRAKSTVAFLLSSDVPFEGTIEIKANALGIVGGRHPSPIHSNTESSIVLEQQSSLRSAIDDALQLNEVPFTLRLQEGSFEGLFILPIEQFMEPKGDFSSILLPFSAECALEQTVLADEKFHRDGQWAAWLPGLELHVCWMEGKLFSDSSSLLNLAMRINN